jgi:hypothetical protein
MDSPEQRRTPQQPVFPQIAPLHFDNVPVPQVPALHGNGIVPDDPFDLPPGPAHFNGHQYNHLPENLAQQLHNLPALPPVMGRGRGRGRGQLYVPAVNVHFFQLLFWRLE